MILRMCVLGLILAIIQPGSVAQSVIESNSVETTAVLTNSSLETNRAPSIDAIQWLLDHKGERPTEVLLVKPISIPIVVGDKTIGLVTKPAGSSLHIEDLNSKTLVSVLNGVSFSVPIESTNLLELVTKRLQIALEGPQPGTTANASATNSIATNPLELINEKLSHSPVNSDELLDLYMKYPRQLYSVLEHQNINLSGQVSKVYVGGVESDRVDITLSQKGPYKITIFCDLKSPYRIVEINHNPDYRNKFDVINGQLLFTSYKGGKKEYRNSGYYSVSPMVVKHEDAESSTKLVCTERSNINPVSVRLKSSNGYNVVFEATSPIQ